MSKEQGQLGGVAAVLVAHRTCWSAQLRRAPLDSRGVQRRRKVRLTERLFDTPLRREGPSKPGNRAPVHVSRSRDHATVMVASRGVG